MSTIDTDVADQPQPRAWCRKRDPRRKQYVVTLVSVRIGNAENLVARHRRWPKRCVVDTQRHDLRPSPKLCFHELPHARGRHEDMLGCPRGPAHRPSAQMVADPAADK